LDFLLSTLNKKLIHRLWYLGGTFLLCSHGPSSFLFFWTNKWGEHFKGKSSCLHNPLKAVTDAFYFLWTSAPLLRTAWRYWNVFKVFCMIVPVVILVEKYDFWPNSHLSFRDEKLKIAIRFKKLITNSVLKVNMAFVTKYLVWLSYVRRSKFRLRLIWQISQFFNYFKISFTKYLYFS
jgi:hypothetical protein